MQSDTSYVRSLILHSLADKSTGHLGGSLGNVEILSILFDHYLDYDSKWYSKSINLSHQQKCELATQMRQNRNKFILSNGHVCPVLYSLWGSKGLLDEYINDKFSHIDRENRLISYLQTIRNIDSDLEGHPSLAHQPFLVDASTGPLGQGAGTSVGYAWSDRNQNNNHTTFVLVGDGECEEGQIWEAAMIAARLKLDNLVWIIDRNYIQIDGDTEVVGGLDNSLYETKKGLVHKFEAFGWLVKENKSGNDYESCQTSLSSLLLEQRGNSRPAVLINYTKVGHPFEMFGTYHWHGKTPTQEQVEQALIELYSK